MHAPARKRMSAVTNIAARIVSVAVVTIVVTDVLVTSHTSVKSQTIRLMCATIVRIAEIVLKTDICIQQS